MVKRYTPNKIANEIMVEDAWHDSEWVRASDYDALAAELASIKAHSKFQADCGRQTSLALIDAGVKSFGFNADGVKELAAERDALRQRLAEAEKDAARYRWLRDRYVAADFAYGDPPSVAMVFEMPGEMRFSPDLDFTIDAEMTPDSASEHTKLGRADSQHDPQHYSSAAAIANGRRPVESTDSATHRENEHE